jgi:hypothetical protein
MNMGSNVDLLVAGTSPSGVSVASIGNNMESLRNPVVATRRGTL